MTVDASAVASVLGITTTYVPNRAGGVLFLPQRIAVFAQGASDVEYSTDKWTAPSAGAAGKRYGFGSPIHLILRELLPVSGDGVGTIPVTIYPLVDGYEAVASTGAIVPTGTNETATSHRVRIGGVKSGPFVIDPEDSAGDIVDKIVDAVNSVLEVPMDAEDGTTQVDLTAKWAGPSGDDIVVEIIGDTDGVEFSITQPTGGLVNPEITDALEQVGSTWETMALNALGVDDSDILDEFQEFGEGRWGTLMHRPLVVFAGNTEEEVADATTVSAARTEDRVNSQLTAPGSVNLPFVVAARQLARIAKMANNNPPTDYVGLRASGLIGGSEWDYIERDQAIKAGSSTSELVGGENVAIADVVTFWRPEGEEPPAYRHVVDIVKIQNIIFNVNLIFAAQSWAGAPLIPDNQATVNPNARQPKSAKTAANNLLDALGLQAIISDPEAAKENTEASIVGPKRLNLKLKFDLSGNTNIKDVELEWGFNFGTAA